MVPKGSFRFVVLLTLGEVTVATVIKRAVSRFLLDPGDRKGISRNAGHGRWNSGIES
jgi:hypothetical protein